MSYTRIICPDSHGSFIDPDAKRAFLADMKYLDAKEIILLGDHVDVGGLFSAHQNNYVEDMGYSYEDDCAAANEFLDAIQDLAPKATIDYLEGNHEAHFSRWVSRTYRNQKDAVGAMQAGAPETKLLLKKRGIRYHKATEFHDGLAIPGLIKRGRCYFTHGMRASKFATAAHLDAVGACVVHGHTHRSQAHIKRNVESGEIGAWCPGTLAKLQPTYCHTAVTDWTHGYAIQLVDNDGSFMHMQIPIIRGKSKMKLLLR